MLSRKFNKENMRKYFTGMATELLAIVVFLLFLLLLTYSLFGLFK